MKSFGNLFRKLRPKPKVLIGRLYDCLCLLSIPKNIQNLVFELRENSRG